MYGYPDYAGPGPGQCYNGHGGGGGQHAAVERLSSHPSHHSPAGSTSTATLRQIPTTILELAASPTHEPVPPERRPRGDRDKERDRDRDKERGENGARPREHHKESRGGRSRRSGVEQEFDSWDYVYKHLEQTGYTKDQAERPDVLESSQSQSDEELRRNIQGLRLRDARNGDGHGQQRARRQESGHRHHQGRGETSESEAERDSRYSSAVSEDTLQPQRQPRGGGHQHQLSTQVSHLSLIWSINQSFDFEWRGYNILIIMNEIK